MKKTKSHPERVSNIIPFRNKYNWEGIDDWKTFEKSNPTIALNIFYEICPAYNSDNNSVREKQIILLMIPNEEK